MIVKELIFGVLILTPQILFGSPQGILHPNMIPASTFFFNNRVINPLNPLNHYHISYIPNNSGGNRRNNQNSDRKFVGKPNSKGESQIIWISPLLSFGKLSSLSSRIKPSESLGKQPTKSTPVDSVYNETVKDEEKIVKEESRENIEIARKFKVYKAVPDQ